MKKTNTKIKRKLRNRKKLKSVNVGRYRISVSKSLNNLSAQIIDDKQNERLNNFINDYNSSQKKRFNKVRFRNFINALFENYDG